MSRPSIAPSAWLILLIGCGSNEPALLTQACAQAVAGSGAMSCGSTSPPRDLPRFSFFVTSLAALRELAGDQRGFGGDLRFGEVGDGAGLRGADKICRTIADKSLPGAGSKEWRAFLSSERGGPDGGPQHAIDRIGEGPWYDRVERLVSMNRADLMQIRPASADPAIRNDLPNEDGISNHNPDGTGEVDNHHVLTGSDGTGRLVSSDATAATCEDWTSAKHEGHPRVGLSWPRGGRGGGRPTEPGQTDSSDAIGAAPGGGTASSAHWSSALDESGCGAGVNIIEMGPPRRTNPSVGSGGGYGAIYCFALTP